MEKLATWCIDEIRRMEDARAHLAWLFEEMEEAATLPLLRDSLQEQRGMIAAQRDRFTHIYEALDVPAGGKENKTVLAMATAARDALRAVEEEGRDTVIAQHAVRVECWELGVWTGLYSVLRQLGHDEAADLIESLVADLRSAERHLEAVHPDVPHSDDEEYDRRSTIRHRPRLPLNIGPVES